MKALSLDDHDRLVAVCNLKIPLMSLMLSLIKKNNNNNGEKIQKWCFECLTGLGGRGLYGFFFYFWGQGPGWVCWNFVEKEASFDFCPCLNISHRMYRKGLKNKLNFFFPLWNKIWGGDNFFLSDQCIARPLIYVDVSLHSNKKKTEK